MKGLSITIIEGRLGKDAEFKVTQGGQSLARFSVAVNRPVKDANSESGWKDATDWFECIAWSKLAEIAANFYKGQEVLVKGRLIQEHWEDAQSGQKRTSWKLQAEELYAIGPRLGQAADDSGGSSSETERSGGIRNARSLYNEPDELAAENIPF